MNRGGLNHVDLYWETLSMNWGETGVHCRQNNFLASANHHSFIGKLKFPSGSYKIADFTEIFLPQKIWGCYSTPKHPHVYTYEKGKQKTFEVHH